ncbi:FCD domain-containing protein (plasmid) [Shinella sumterensis]|nr:FCD domain-containing protein [Shinella sumterensis]
MNDLFEFRMANECMAAKLAAQRRSATHLVRLKDVLEQMEALCLTPESPATAENVELYFSIDTRFHLVIAEAAGNEYLTQAAEEA